MKPTPEEKRPTAKHGSRKRGRAARCALEPAFCRQAARDLSERLIALPEIQRAHLLLVYSATDEEIDLAPTIAALRSRGAAIAYPRIEEAGVLALHVVEDESELVPGPFGIREPSASAPRADAAALDAVIVPGVAFDERGVRVGFGGGFYDRLLPLVTGALRVGVAFDEQIAEDLPAEPHDALMDVVVTPTRELRTGARPTP